MTTKAIANPETELKPLLDQHPLAAGLFPLMEGEEFDALVADIRANGLRNAIVTYEGLILDGFNRARACREVGFEPNYQEVDDFHDEPVDAATARAYVISVNAHRRHLSSEQKRAVIEAAIKKNPEKSDRLIAEEAKTDHKVVGRARRRMESTGATPQLSKRTGSDGKTRTQKPAKQKAPTEKVKSPSLASDKRGDVGPVSSGETDRLRVRLGELEQENRRLTHINGALVSEIEELKSFAKIRAAVPDPIGLLVDDLDAIFLAVGERQGLFADLSKDTLIEIGKVARKIPDITNRLLTLTQPKKGKTKPAKVEAESVKAKPESASPSPSVDDELFHPMFDRTTRH